MTLTFVMCLVAIEAIGENILAGQEFVLPPYPEISEFFLFFFLGRVIFFELLVQLCENFRKMLNTLLSMT